MKKYIIEFIGTFALIFLGCGSFILAGNSIGMFGVSLTFGLATAGLYYGLSKGTGVYLNPAVALGAMINKRISLLETLYTIAAELLGSLFAALSVYLLAIGNVQYNLTYGLGQNAFGDQSLGGYNLSSAIIFELIATFILVYVYLSATKNKKDRKQAGLALGFVVTASYLMGMPIDGASLNPARSFGPSVIAGFSDKVAWMQLPVFLIVPLLGGVLAAFLYKYISTENAEIELIIDPTEVVVE